MKSPSQRQPSPPPSKGTGTRVPPIKGMPIGNKSGMDTLATSKAKHVNPAQLAKQGPSNPKSKTTTLPHTKKRRKAELKKLPKPPGGMGSGLIAGAYASRSPAINRPARAQKKF
jgi:hypothetical protein